MKSLVLLLNFLSIHFLLFVSSTKIERFGNLHYQKAASTQTEWQKNLATKGYYCATVNITPPLTTFNSIPKANETIAKGIVLTPTKHGQHPENSPLVSFASFFDSEHIEICTVDHANQDPTTQNKDFISVNWVIIEEEFLGGLTDSTWTQGRDINVPLNLDIRTNVSYAFLNGVCQHEMQTRNESHIIDHYDVVWLQSMDSSSKLASFAWTDNTKPRLYHEHKDHQVYVTGVAFPTGTLAQNGMEAQKDYDAGVIHFYWPSNETAIGYCQDVPFNMEFDYTPTIMAGVLNNMNTESISQTVWVEKANEKGCKLCVSIVNGVTNTPRLIRETTEQDGLYLYWAAFTHLYTEEELKNQSPPVNTLISIEGLNQQPPTTSETQKALFSEILSLVNASAKIPDGFLDTEFTHVISGLAEIDFFLDTNSAQYIIDLAKSLNGFKLDSSHSSFMTKWGATETTTFVVQYGQASVMSPNKIESGQKCSVAQCSDENPAGGVITSVKKLLIPGINSFGNVASDSVSTEQFCNTGPCSYSNKKYHLYYDNTTSTYVLQDYVVKNTGLIVGLIVAVIVVIVVAVILFATRKKTKSFVNKVQARFHQFV